MATQILTGIHISGAGAPVAGRQVRATPIPGQYTDASTIDTAVQVLTAASAQDGTWSLTIIQGAVYEIKIDKWGMRTIRVTADATKEFTTYLDDNAFLGAPVTGGIKIGARYIRPTLTDENGTPVDLANILSIEGLSLGWEII
jgi:hypothetical protein